MTLATESCGDGVEIHYPSVWIDSVEALVATRISGLHAVDVSILGVELGTRHPVPWTQSVSLGVRTFCPMLGGGEVVVRLSTEDGSFWVDLDGADAGGFDLEVGMDWFRMVGWLPDTWRLIGDDLVKGMRLDGDIVALSMIDGARVLSGAAWAPEAGARVSSVNAILLRTLSKRAL